MTKHKALQLVLAVALAAASVVVPFLMATTHSKVGLLTVMLAFFSLGLALVVLGVILVARSRLAHPRRAEALTTDREQAASLGQSGGGWLWVGVGLALLASQSVYLLLYFFPPQPS